MYVCMYGYIFLLFFLFRARIVGSVTGDKCFIGMVYFVTFIVSGGESKSGMPITTV